MIDITLQGEAEHGGRSRMQIGLFIEKQLTIPSAAVCICQAKDSANERREEEMKNQTENQNEKMESKSHGAAFAFLVAGLGIGAALSVFLAPKSGAETREWIEAKCLDGVDTANAKVRQARMRMHELVDQGQQKLSEAVIARREAAGRTKSQVPAS